MNRKYAFEENNFYAPCMDDCWIELAKEIMSSLSESYAHQFPTCAYSQVDYDHMDYVNNAPKRRHILKCLKYGPIKNIAKIDVLYSGMEKRRQECKKEFGIHWKDRSTEDLDAI